MRCNECNEVFPINVFYLFRNRQQGVSHKANASLVINNWMNPRQFLWQFSSFVLCGLTYVICYWVTRDRDIKVKVFHWRLSSLICLTRLSVLVLYHIKGAGWRPAEVNVNGYWLREITKPTSALLRVRVDLMLRIQSFARMISEDLKGLFVTFKTRNSDRMEIGE